MPNEAGLIRPHGDLPACDPREPTIAPEGWLMGGVKAGGTEDPGTGDPRKPVKSERRLRTEGPSRAAVEGPVPERQDAAEMAKELVVDLRAELPRIDARAAAGVALTAAILLGVVPQAPPAMPIYAVAVIAAALLTVALLLFLTVLLPSPTLLSHQILLRDQPGAAVDPPDISAVSALDGSFGLTYRAARHGKRQAELRRLEERGRQLADQLAVMDRAEYHAQVALQLAGQLRAKQRLLLLAFASGSFAVASLAVGATWALLLGWR